MSTASGSPNVIDLLLERPERLEAGVLALDRRLRLDADVEVDALLRDALGYPLIVLVARGEVASELARIAAVSAALSRGRFLLERLYGAQGLQAAMRPRFVLLAPRFPDHAPALLDLLGAVEVHAYEYRIVKTAGRAVLDLASFHRSAGSSLAGLPPAWRTAPDSTARLPAASAPSRPQTPPPAPTATRDALPDAAELRLLDDEPAAPDAARGLFLRARDSIRALSSQVVESHSNGAVQYRVHDRLLATLTLDAQGFRLAIGEQEAAGTAEAAAGRAVRDEPAFNEGLNEVFELYFHSLGPDRPGA